eukprot:3938747-Rhodomonas_salina.1
MPLVWYPMRSQSAPNSHVIVGRRSIVEHIVDQVVRESWSIVELVSDSIRVWVEAHAPHP